MTKVVVIGLGYVGTVAVACLAEAGHIVAAVDVQEAKVKEVAAGTSPIVEPGLQELIKRGVESGSITATTSLDEAAADADTFVICVGTPTHDDGTPDLSFVRGACRALAVHLRSNRTQQVVVTSTVPPGTSEQHCIPNLEAGGAKMGVDFDYAFVPEFLREGSAVSDYQNPERLVIGTPNATAAPMVEALFAPYPPRMGIHYADLAVAEITKVTDNCWHALKVAFTNEVARISSREGIDATEVMKIFRADLKLNISAAYMKPGFAYGGSCLPKDLRAMNFLASANGAQTPILAAVARSNQCQIDEAFDTIASRCPKTVALLGVTFKAETDDCRESPLLLLADKLTTSGYALTIHDSYLDPNRLFGQNRNALVARQNILATALTDDLDAALRDADLVVVGQSNPLYSTVLDHPTLPFVLDLCGIARPSVPNPRYAGLSW